MKIVSSFSERLTEAMNGMGVTEFASKLGISKQSVSAYINGTRQPKQLALTAMAQILSVHPAWLMGYDVEKYAPVDNKKQTIEVDTQLMEFVELFSHLSEDKQKFIISSMRGLISDEDK